MVQAVLSWFCTVPEKSVDVYKECTSDHKRTLYSRAIRRAIVFWNIIYAYITVNFYWSELDTLSGQIYCTLDIFGYCTVI